ncbi:MAG: glycosyltransferase [Propionibacteriaceae bacterium]|jgi:hypothetical protein|nr:glycosyltransferase [Propionibacteriaceae bacterium]
MTTTTPAYSIIVPVHNSSAHIAPLLDSIPRRDDVEVILVDDRSTPEEAAETWALAQSRAFPHLVTLTNVRTPGPGGARNTALEAARGRWIVFADSDDAFTDQFGPALDRYAAADTDLVVFRPKTTPGGVRTTAMEVLFDAGDLDIYTARHQELWARFVRRELIALHGLRLNEDCLVMDDVLFSLDAVKWARSAVQDANAIYQVSERVGSLTARLLSVEELLQIARVRVAQAAFLRDWLPADRLPEALPTCGQLLLKSLVWHGPKAVAAIAKELRGHQVPLTRHANPLTWLGKAAKVVRTAPAVRRGGSR